MKKKEGVKKEEQPKTVKCWVIVTPRGKADMVFLGAKPDVYEGEILKRGTVTF